MTKRFYDRWHFVRDEPTPPGIVFNAWVCYMPPYQGVPIITGVRDFHPHIQAFVKDGYPGCLPYDEIIGFWPVMRPEVPRMEDWK